MIFWHTKQSKLIVFLSVCALFFCACGKSDAGPKGSEYMNFDSTATVESPLSDFVYSETDDSLSFLETAENVVDETQLDPNMETVTVVAPNTERTETIVETEDLDLSEETELESESKEITDDFTQLTYMPCTNVDDALNLLLSFDGTTDCYLNLAQNGYSQECLERLDIDSTKTIKGDVNSVITRVDAQNMEGTDEYLCIKVVLVDDIANTFMIVYNYDGEYITNVEFNKLG